LCRRNGGRGVPGNVISAGKCEKGRDKTVMEKEEDYERLRKKYCNAFLQQVPVKVKSGASRVWGNHIQRGREGKKYGLQT
jgi:hypothetical protein